MGDLFNITNEGEIDTYLGVKISRPTPDTIELTQPHLIQQILSNVEMKSNTKTKDKAAPSSTILRCDLDGAPFNKNGSTDLSWASSTSWRNSLVLKSPTPFTVACERYQVFVALSNGHKRQRFDPQSRHIKVL